MALVRGKQISKAVLFVDALIQHDGNATEAAKAAFSLGSKGGKDIQRTAESMGYEYMRKPEVKRLLRVKFQCLGVNKMDILSQLKELAEQRKDLQVARDSLIAIAKMCGYME